MRRPFSFLKVRIGQSGWPFHSFFTLPPLTPEAVLRYSLIGGIGVVAVARTEHALEVADRIQGAYEALGFNDIDLFLSAFTPDARWHLLANGAGLPFTGVHIGQQAIRQLIGSIFRDFTMRDFFVDDVIVGENSAAVRWSALSTSIATGRKSQIDVFDHLVLHEGRIASLTQFFDTAAVAESAGLVRVIPREDAVT
jgi:ketosteroid isomerase-like protein